MWIFGFCAQKYQFHHLFLLIQDISKKHVFHFFMFCDLKKVHFWKISQWGFSNIWSFRRVGRGGVNWSTFFSDFKGSICVFGFRTSLWTWYFEVLNGHFDTFLFFCFFFTKKIIHMVFLTFSKKIELIFKWLFFEKNSCH